MIAQQTTDEPEMVPTRQAAALVGISRVHLLNLAHRGMIRSRRVPQRRHPGYEIHVCLEDVRILFPARDPGGDEISVGDAARLLRVTRTTILRYIAEGRITAREIPGTRWGHRYILRRADMEKLVTQRRPDPGEVTVEDAALIAGVTHSTIWKAIRDGHLAARPLIQGQVVPLTAVLDLWPTRELGLITQAQAARLLNVSRQRIEQLLDQGKLDEWRTPHGKRYVHVESVARCLDHGDAHYAPQE